MMMDSGAVDGEDEEGIIRCICGYTHDDGFTIQCEKCLVWQHAICVNITKNSVPDQYYCEECDPRPGLDPDHAHHLQRRKLSKNNHSNSTGGNSKSRKKSLSSLNSLNTSSTFLAAQGLSQPSSAVSTQGNNNTSSFRNNNNNSNNNGDDSDYYDELDDIAQDFIPTACLIIDDDLKEDLNSLIQSQNGSKESSSELFVKKETDDSAEQEQQLLQQQQDEEEQKSEIESLMCLQKCENEIGVFALVDLAKGRISQITGALAKQSSSSAASVSAGSNEKFVFNLQTHEHPLQLSDFILDCKRFGNEWRFMRYSDIPNCILQIHRTKDQEFQTWVVASTDITAGSELTLPKPGSEFINNNNTTTSADTHSSHNYNDESSHNNNNNNSSANNQKTHSHRSSNPLPHPPTLDSKQRERFDNAIRKDLQAFAKNIPAVSSILAVPFDNYPRNIKKVWMHTFIEENGDIVSTSMTSTSSFIDGDNTNGIGFTEDDDDLLVDSLTSPSDEESGSKENKKKRKEELFVITTPPIPLKKKILVSPIKYSSLHDSAATVITDSMGSLDSKPSSEDLMLGSAVSTGVSSPVSAAGSKRPANDEPAPTRISLQDYKKKRKLMDNK